MPNCIIKQDPDVDWYVLWSDVTESPSVWGPKAEVQAEAWDPKDVAEDRFERADKTGCSYQWEKDPDGPSKSPYGWDDTGLIFMQLGVLPRERLREACDRLAALPRDASWPVLKHSLDGLLRPFED